MLTIVRASDSDVPALAGLMEELDRFYGAVEVEPRAEREKQIREALFAGSPAAHVLLARDGAELVGMASYSLLWPAAGVTASMFLKELYVRQDRQRQGVGQALMRELAAIAVETRCSRLEWQTETTNEAAVSFYRSLAAEPFEGKVFFRVAGSDLRQLAQS